MCRIVADPLHRLSNGTYFEGLEALYCRSRNAGNSSHAYWKRVQRGIQGLRCRLCHGDCSAELRGYIPKISFALYLYMTGLLINH